MESNQSGNPHGAVPTCSNAKVPGSLAALIETLMLTRMRVRIPVPPSARIRVIIDNWICHCGRDLDGIGRA